MRELAEQAHGANRDLGWGLMNNLATVDPGDMSVVIWGRFSRVIDVKERPLDRLVGGVICGCC
jgi:hypothetical protein